MAWIWRNKKKHVGSICFENKKLNISFYNFPLCMGIELWTFPKAAWFIYLFNLKFKASWDIGAEFVVPFASRSHALKLSLKSHQMTTFFVQKRSLSENCYFKQVVIWRLFKDDLRAREREEKVNTKFCAMLPSTAHFISMKEVHM